MKITVALLLVVMSQGFASVGFSQRQVSLNLKNVRLDKVDIPTNLTTFSCYKLNVLTSLSSIR